MSVIVADAPQSTVAERRRSIRLLTDAWIRLGVLGVVLILGVVFVHTPATVWAGNVAEFHFPFGKFLGPGLAIALRTMRRTDT